MKLIFTIIIVCFTSIFWRAEIKTNIFSFTDFIEETIQDIKQSLCDPVDNCYRDIIPIRDSFPVRSNPIKDNFPVRSNPSYEKTIPDLPYDKSISPPTLPDTLSPLDEPSVSPPKLDTGPSAVPNCELDSWVNFHKKVEKDASRCD